MAHVTSSLYLPQSHTVRPELVTIDGCLRQALQMERQRSITLKLNPPEHLRRIFTALANGDAHVGLLAYYLWRRPKRR